MYIEYFGLIDIQYWEYVVLFFYLVVLYLYFARRKNMAIATNPEYRYLLRGLFAKVIGGIAFSLIYFYYYRGGDTIAYFYSSVAMSNLAKQAPLEYLHVLFGANDMAHRALFTEETGKPFLFIFVDDRAFMVVRLISPITMITFNSYLITTVLIASLSFGGVWRLFQMFYRYFPRLHARFAIAILYMPSSILWGSALLKDTFTFSAFCWYLHSVDNLFFRKVDRFSSVVALVLSSMVIIYIKAYIFMVVFPISLLWISYSRLARIRNAAIKYLVLPFGFAAITAGTFVVLTSLGDKFGKFSLDSSLESIIIAQKDLKHVEEYGSNFFDVGELEHSWTSVLSKFPTATSATLFRPFLTECKNFVMVLSGLENFFLLALFTWVMWRCRIFFFFNGMFSNPLLLVCFAFSLLYGFVTGITTPNFGALVRFRIPLIPLFVSGLYIMLFLLDERRKVLNRGLNFRFDKYRNGDPARQEYINAQQTVQR